MSLVAAMASAPRELFTTLSIDFEFGLLMVYSVFGMVSVDMILLHTLPTHEVTE